jgi:hypothetical protein
LPVDPIVNNDPRPHDVSRRRHRRRDARRRSLSNTISAIPEFQMILRVLLTLPFAAAKTARSAKIAERT